LDIENSKENDLEIESYLGVRSYGSVILTWNTESKCQFAVKIIKLENSNDKAIFRQETNIILAFRTKYLLDLSYIFFSNNDLFAIAVLSK